ncbi:MAG: hypothetical protein ABSH41_09735 [Syntrophobacteraceae bacterium]
MIEIIGDGSGGRSTPGNFVACTRKKVRFAEILTTRVLTKNDLESCIDPHSRYGVLGENVKPSTESIKRRFVKAGARVVYHARRWYVHIASAFPSGRYYGILFA